MPTLKVKTWHNDRESRVATENTIKALPHGGTFLRNANGEFDEDVAGFLTVVCEDPSFLHFAIEHQGYAHTVVLLPDPE